MSNGITVGKLGYARYEIDPNKTGNILIPSDWTVEDVNEYKAINFKFTYEWTGPNKCEIRNISWYPVKIEVENGERTVTEVEFIENSPFMKGKSDGATLSIRFNNTEIIDENYDFSLNNQLEPLYASSNLIIEGIQSKYFICNFLYSYEEQIQRENDNNNYATIKYFIKIDNIKIPKTSKYEHNVVFTEDGISELVNNIRKYPVTDIETIESNDEDNNGNNIWEHYTEGQPCIKIKYGDTEKEFFYDENELIKTKGYKYVKVGSNIKFKDADGNNIDALVVEDVDQSLGTFRVQINNEIFEVPIAGFYSGDDSLKIDGHLYPAKDDKYNIGKIEAINYEEASEYDPDKTYYVSDGYAMVDNIEDGQTFYEPTYKYVRATEYNANEEYYEGINPVQATEYDPNTQYYEYNYSVFDSHAESVEEVGFNPLTDIQIASAGDGTTYDNLTVGENSTYNYEFYTDESHWFLLLKNNCNLKFLKSTNNVSIAALGGGGGGGGSWSSVESDTSTGGGGGGGGYLSKKSANINENTIINITIGAGGNIPSGTGGQGGSTIVQLTNSTFIDDNNDNITSITGVGGNGGNAGAKTAGGTGGTGGANGGNGSYGTDGARSGASGTKLFEGTILTGNYANKDIIYVGPGGGGGGGKVLMNAGTANSYPQYGGNGLNGTGDYGAGGHGAGFHGENASRSAGTSGIVALRGSYDSSSSIIDVVNFPADETYYIQQDDNYIEADPQPTTENYQEDIDYYVRTLDEVNSSDIDTSDMSQYYMFSGYEIADPQPSAAEYYKYYIKVQDSYKKYEPIYEYRKATQYSNDETYYKPISFIQASTYDNEKSYYEEVYTEFNSQSSSDSSFNPLTDIEITVNNTTSKLSTGNHISDLGYKLDKDDSAWELLLTKNCSIKFLTDLDNVDVAAIGGGGAGGSRADAGIYGAGGGGGGGGYISIKRGNIKNNTTATVVIGAGGTGASASGTASTVSLNNNSTFSDGTTSLSGSGGIGGQIGIAILDEQQHLGYSTGGAGGNGGTVGGQGGGTTNGLNGNPGQNGVNLLPSSLISGQTMIVVGQSGGGGAGQETSSSSVGSKGTDGTGSIYGAGGHGEGYSTDDGRGDGTQGVVMIRGKCLQNSSSDSTEFIENETYYIQQNDSYVEADPQPTAETISQNTYYIKAYNEIDNDLINQENVSQYFIPNGYQEIINSIAQQDIQKYYTREFIGYSRDGESSGSDSGYYIQIFKKADPQPNEENFNNKNYYIQSTDSLRWKNINISGDIYMTDSQSIFSLKGGEVGQFLCGNGKDNNPFWSNYYNGKFYVTDDTDAKRYNGDTYESISANELIENNLLTVVVQYGTCNITPSQLSREDITYRIEPSGTVDINAIIYLFEIKDSGTTRTGGRLRDSEFKNHLEQLGFQIGEPNITNGIYKFNSQYNANKYYIYENNKYIQCEENKNYPNTIFYYVKDTNDPAVGLGENDATVEGSITTLGGIAARKSIKGYKVHGAVFNDYAEYRHTDSLMPGRCVIETGRGDLILSTSRLQLGANIISDTFGFSIGESSYANTPIAVCGRVLAYPYEDINSYQPGDAVCSGPNGTISKMTRKEIQEWPDAIIGTVSEIPQYEIWGSDAIKVDGRIWIKVK